MTAIGRGLIFVAVVVAAGTVAAKEREIVVKVDDVGVRATKSEKIDRSTARKVLKAGRTAYVKVANHFVLNSKSVFHLTYDRPPWAKWSIESVPRIWIVLGETLRTKDMGADPYLKRMKRGDLEVYLPAPGKDLTADDLHRIYREMCHAILAQTTWCACPRWLREGIAEYYGTMGSDGEHAALATMKEALKEGVEDCDLGELLTTTSREKWARAGGRAVSWALVTMMEQSEKKFVPSLFNQSRLFLNHLKRYPGTSAVEKEFANLVFTQLKESGLTSERLKVALKAFVAADFPEGSAFRRTEAYKICQRVRLPKLYGVGLTGRFGIRRSFTDEYDKFHIHQPFNGGSASWRLPWPANLQVWIGVRGKPGTNYGLRPRAGKDGQFLAYDPREVSRTGKMRLTPQVMELRTGSVKWGFIWAGVTSPTGLGFIFRHEYKMK